MNTEISNALLKKVSEEQIKNANKLSHSSDSVDLDKIDKKVLGGTGQCPFKLSTLANKPDLLECNDLENLETNRPMLNNGDIESIDCEQPNINFAAKELKLTPRLNPNESRVEKSVPVSKF